MLCEVRGIRRVRQKYEQLHIFDGQSYNVIGETTIDDPFAGESYGIMIEFESFDKDCGLGFIFKGQGYILTKSIAPGGIVINGQSFGPLSVATPFDVNKPLKP